MIKKILFPVLAVVLLSFTMHKYYISITEIDYNAKSKTFEISIKFIGHDLEKALTNAGAPNLYLGTEKEVRNANAYLKRYIERKFKMVVDDKQLEHEFIGKEINNDDFIYCFLQSNKVEDPKEITIKSTLLTELFSRQANTIYLKSGDQKVSYYLTKDKVSETHTLIQALGK